MDRLRSYFTTSPSAPEVATTPPPTTTAAGSEPQRIAEKDPESLLPRQENRSMQRSLMRAFAADNGRKWQGKKERDLSARDVLDHFYRLAENDATKDREEFHAAVKGLVSAKNISNIQPGDYCARFANGEMLNVGINVLAEAASVASCMGAAHWLVGSFAPSSTVGSVPTTVQGPANVPSPTAAAGYSWKDMGYTSIFAGSAYLMKQGFKDLYLGIAQAYLLKGRHDPVSAMEENFNRYLESEYEPLKNDIPEDVRVAVTKIISRVRSLYDDLRPDKTKQTNMQLNDITTTRAFIGMAEYWLKSFLPLAKNGLPLMEAPGWRDREETVGKLLQTEDLLKIYKDPLSRSQTLHLPLSQACRSVEKSEYAIPAEMLDRPVKDVTELSNDDDIRDWHHWHDIEDVPQKLTMFVGPPGSGKSYIKKILSVWDTPNFEQTYQPLNQGGVAAGDPAKWRAAYQTEYITREGDLLGERIFKMFLAQYRNAHRYLDEPSWDDTEGAKRDTDPNVEKLYSECIEASYRILESCTSAMTNKVPIVDSLQTAEEIVKNIDPAFMSRFELVLVGASDPEAMRTIAKKAYRALASRFCLPFKDGRPAPGSEQQRTIPAKLDEDQQQRLLSAFLSVLDRLVELHAEKKGELRMFTDVEPVFMEIVSRLLLENAPGHERMENAHIQQWVEEYFARMPNRNPYSQKKETDKGKAPDYDFQMLIRERERLQREVAALRGELDGGGQQQDAARPAASGSRDPGPTSAGDSSRVANTEGSKVEPAPTVETSRAVQLPGEGGGTGSGQVSTRRRERISAWLSNAFQRHRAGTA